LLRFLATLRPGEVVQGTVTRIENFGVFVDLDGGPEPEIGFVPVPELSWKWISSAHEAVAVGQRVSAEVLALDTETRGQATLSLCALQENPWKAWADRVGSVATGRVTGNFVPHGVFVTLEDGIAGLLPYGELGPPGQQQTVDHGSELTVQVVDVEVPLRRMRLSVPN
jgi:ribosomal protein S1